MCSEKTTLQQYKKNLTALNITDWSELEDLAKKGIAGDGIAFNRTVEALLPLVLKIAGTFGKLPEQDMCELIQTGNVTVCEAVHKWRPDGVALSSWVYRNVRRDMGRCLKRERQFRNVHLPEETVTIMGQIDQDEDNQLIVDKSSYDGMPDDDPNVNPERVTDYGVMSKAMGKLTHREKAILTILKKKGLTTQQAADSENISKQGVSLIYQRALSKLKRLLT